MMILRLVGDFNSRHPWDHTAHYYSWLFRQLPKPVGSALDVGCGMGDLARLLADRCELVEGIDRDEKVIEFARQENGDRPNVRFILGDGLSHPFPDARYDVITCLAALHHLPLAEALRAFRQRLAPGGTLIVIGLYREHTLPDYAVGAIALPANMLMGWVKNRRRGRGDAATGPPTTLMAPIKDPSMTLPQIRKHVQRELPGAKIRRRLFFRYSLVYRA